MAVGQVASCSSDSTPSLGTAICHRCSPKKQNIIIQQNYEQFNLINLITYYIFLEKIYWPTLAKEDKELWVALHLLKKVNFLKKPHQHSYKNPIFKQLHNWILVNKERRNCTMYIRNPSKTKGRRVEQTSRTLFVKKRRKRKHHTCFIICFLFVCLFCLFAISRAAPEAYGRFPG